MKRKLLVFILSIIMVFGTLSITAYAVDIGGTEYDDNDFYKLQAFLNQPSEIAGQTNGQRINITAYNPADPATWIGVEWNNDTPKRVMTVNASGSWRGLGLAGSLDVSGFSALTELLCDGCGLVSLDASDNPVLTRLDCSNNQLTSLDISADAALTELHCHTNQLTSLDVSASTALVYLYCDNNQLTSLDVGANTALTSLSCGDNQLSALNVGANTALVYLNCEHNLLASLDVRALTALEALDCSHNDLTTLDVGANPALLELDCSANDLTELDVSANTALQFLYCNDNRLTLIKASINGSNIEIWSNGNGTVGLSVDEGGYAVATPNDGATFVGWMGPGGGFTEAEYPITPGSGYYPLMAFFSPCTVIFDKNDGDTEATPASMNVELGGVIEMPPEPPTRAGHTFGGWYRDKECTLPWDLANDIVMANMTLYAKWIGPEPTQTPPTSEQTSSPALVLSMSPSDGKIYTGGRVTITPNIPGGTWQYDEEHFSRSGETFTGLKEGMARVTYTVGRQSAYVDVMVSRAELPSTGQDFTPAIWLLALSACAGGLFLVLNIHKRRKTCV